MHNALGPPTLVLVRHIICVGSFCRMPLASRQIRQSDKPPAASDISPLARLTRLTVATMRLQRNAQILSAYLALHEHTRRTISPRRRNRSPARTSARLSPRLAPRPSGEAH